MFKQRLTTTLILGPCVILIMFFIPHFFFKLIILSLVLICALEWLSLIPVQNFLLASIFIFSVFVFIWIMQFKLTFWLHFICIMWALTFLAILYFPASQTIWGNKIFVWALGLIFLPAFAQTMIKIHYLPYGNLLIIYLLLLVWAADIGAYVIGKFCGSHKLIPKVSPGKTIEGSAGGFLFAMSIAVASCFYLKQIIVFTWLFQAAAIILVSMIGDLFISMLKRRVGLKDTGNLLPGHGGLLDRLDSLIAASPIFYYYLLLG